MHPAIKTFKFYWKVYGGARALLHSPYVYLAAGFTALCWPLWVSPSSDSSAWPQIAIDVIPSMLGFSMGGMAIVLAFSTAKVFTILAEEGADDSYFITMMGSFFHFILVQSGAILLAVAIKAYPLVWLSGIGFCLFSYAVLVGLATAGQLLLTGKVINYAESIKGNNEDEGRTDELIRAVNGVGGRLDRILDNLLAEPRRKTPKMAAKARKASQSKMEETTRNRAPKK